jgi:hypothetical protein
MQAMTPRFWAFSLAPILAASSAYAQAPGEYDPYYAPAPPSSYAPAPAPAPANPCSYAEAPRSWMVDRVAIGLSLGSMSVSPDEAPEGTETQFRIGELALRYRMSRRLELEFALSGGREVLESSEDGDLAAGSVTLALRYRFRPEQRWGWWIMGGLGGTVIAPHESTEVEREGAQRPLGMMGIGVERRFRRFALQAEVRGFGLGPRKDATEDVPVAVDGGGAPMPVARLPASAAVTHAEELGGGTFTIGASYYF